LEGADEVSVDPAKAVAARLRYMGAGLLAILNSYSFRLARMDFPHLLLEDPLLAYKAVLGYTGGDRAKARYIMTYLLVGLVGRAGEVEAAVAALERGDPEPIRRLLESLRKSRRR
jgi:hypothetical protein